MKKGGAGKANWGAPDEEQKYEHLEAEEAVKLAEEDGATVATEKAEKEPAQKEVKEPEEEEVNNLTYAEYIAQKKANQTSLVKNEKRKPEEIKVKNIQKYDKNDNTVKTITSNIKKHEAYAPSGISGNVEVGFQPLGDEVEEESYDRPRGRGGRGGRGGFRGDRGGRGDRGRGDRGRGDRDAPRADRGAPRGGRGGKAKKFAAQEDDFPAL